MRGGVALIWLALAGPVGAGDAARAFHEAMPDTSVQGMAGASAASMATASAMLTQAMASARTTPVDAPAPPQEARVPTPRGRLGQVRAAPTGLDGSMAENLRAIIVARMGPEACVEVTEHRLLKSGAGFRAQCDARGVFDIHQTRAQARVAACAHDDMAGAACAP